MIDDEGIMLRRNDSDPHPSSVEIHIPNGVGEFTFQYRKAFTGANNRILSVSVNNEEVFLSPIFGNTSEEDPTLYTQTILVYQQGNVVIKFGYPSTITNGNRHITLDNFSWTKVLPNPTALDPEYVSVDNFISNWDYNHTFESFEIYVSDFKNRLFTQTESFEIGLDTSGYEELWEVDLIGGRWILDNVLRTTQHTSGNYGAQMQADYGKIFSPVFSKPKSISFYAKRGSANTSLNLSMKIGNQITSLHDFAITNSEFQLYTYTLSQIPDEASFIFSNRARVLYMDDLAIESEGFIKLPLNNSPFYANSSTFSNHIHNLEPNTKYFFKIKANYNSNSSGYSEEIELMTKDGVIWNGNNWQFGNPSATKVAVLRGNGEKLTSFQAKSLYVENDLEIPSGTTIHLVEYFKNYFNHSIIFQEGAFLIQDNDEVTNYGNATFNRNATFFGYDSKFWSSPVSNQSIANFFANPSAVFNYNEPTRNWIRTNDTTFQAAKGYAIQVGTNFPFMGQGQEVPFTGSFTGVPNNGEYTVAATNTATALGDNGVGNPYGSPISMEKFMQANPKVKTLYFWNENAHYNPGSNPPSYLGQTWYSYNRTGSNNGPKNHIGPGVGFIARVTENAELIFNNQMRESANFESSQNRISHQKDRFWLSLNFNQNKENQILIGYVEGATNGIDEKYDAKNISNNNSFILSHSNNNAKIIEGRAYPLVVTDKIPLYFRAKIAGEYTIKLEDVEGIFNSQPIYLIDKELNLSIKLKEKAEYSFETTIGDFPSRFEIRYQPKETLTTIDLEESEVLIIYNVGNEKYVKSKFQIVGYEIFDLSGKLINQTKINNEYNFKLLDINAGIYIIKFRLINGKEILKTLVY